jgi:hypothetical protein
MSRNKIEINPEALERYSASQSVGGSEIKSGGTNKIVLGKQARPETRQSLPMPLEQYSDEGLQVLMNENQRLWNDNREKFLEAQKQKDVATMSALGVEFRKIQKENSIVTQVINNRQLANEGRPPVKRLIRDSVGQNRMFITPPQMSKESQEKMLRDALGSRHRG